MVLSWPNAMVSLEEDQIAKTWYPKFATKRLLLKPNKPLTKKIMGEAEKHSRSISILQLRIDLLGYIRSFSKHPREIWNRGERLDRICKIIVEHTLELHNFSDGPSKSELAEHFDVIENLKLNYMK